jgi:hypothetical protein
MSAFGLQAVSTADARAPSRRSGSEMFPLALLALAGGVAFLGVPRGRAVNGSARARAR